MQFSTTFRIFLIIGSIALLNLSFFIDAPTGWIAWTVGISAVLIIISQIIELIKASKGNNE